MVIYHSCLSARSTTTETELTLSVQGLLLVVSRRWQIERATGFKSKYEPQNIRAPVGSQSAELMRWRSRKGAFVVVAQCMHKPVRAS